MIGIMVLILIYITPSMIALGRKHRNGVAITVLNILAGWTFFGWIGSMVWACTDNVER